MTPETANSADETSDDTVVTEGRTEAGLLRVFTRVAHGEHLHASVQANPIRFTRRRPVRATGAPTHQFRGTTARKVIWS